MSQEEMKNLKQKTNKIRNEIETNLVYFQNHRKHSVNFCLWILGAPHSEVYVNRHGNDWRLRLPTNAKQRSIYDRFSKHELRDWAKYLRNESLKKFHPDLHKGKEKYYTAVCQNINEVYAVAMKILDPRKKRHYYDAWN